MRGLWRRARLAPDWNRRRESGPSSALRLENRGITQDFEPSCDKWLPRAPLAARHPLKRIPAAPLPSSPAATPPSRRPAMIAVQSRSAPRKRYDLSAGVSRIPRYRSETGPTEFWRGTTLLIWSSGSSSTRRYRFKVAPTEFWRTTGVLANHTRCKTPGRTFREPHLDVKTLVESLVAISGLFSCAHAIPELRHRRSRGCRSKSSGICTG